MGSSQHKTVRTAALIAAGICLLTFFVYWNAFYHGFSIYDDGDYVTANQHVLKGFTLESLIWALRSGEAANWHPLTWMSHMADVQLFGLNARYHHLTNLLLHLANCLLLFHFLRRVTGSVWRSAFAASVFALHPLHVESVAWIAERKDVLSAFFGMLALIAYARYARDPSRTRLVAVSVLFAAGLMAKPMLVTLPCVLLLLDFWPLGRYEAMDGKHSGQRPSNVRTVAGTIPLLFRFVREKALLFLLAALSSVITYSVQRSWGAMTYSGEVSFADRTLNAAVSYCRYLLKFFLPYDLSVFYPFSQSILQWWIVGVSVILLASVSVYAFRKRERFPPFFVGWFWFLGMLIPVIGLVQVGFQAMADRYMYMPMIGLLLAVIWGVPMMLGRIRLRRSLVAAAGAAALIVLALLSRSQVDVWRDDVSLFRHAIDVTSDNWIAHNNLGTALASRGDSLQALAEFREAVRIRPNYSDAQNNLAVNLSARGMAEEGYARFAEAVRLSPRDVELRVNYGILLLKQERYADAAAQFDTSLMLSPANATAHYLLGKSYASLDKPEESLKQCREALASNPGNADVHNVIGSVMAKQGDFSEARREFETALRLDSNNADAYNYLGMLAEAADSLQDAMSMYARAVRLDSNHWSAQYHLAGLYARRGDPEEAYVHCRKAVEVNPRSAEAQNNLANLLAFRGDTAEAEEHYRRAVGLNPDFAMAHFNFGNFLAAKARYAEAAEQYTAALRARPAFAEAKAALENMRSRAGSGAPR